MKHENKIVTLFEAENGLWGTKDAEGNVFDEPEYELHESIDGQEYFVDNKNGLFCDFTSQGFITTDTFNPNDEDDVDVDLDETDDVLSQTCATPITEYVYRLTHVKKYREDYGYPEFPVSITEFIYLSFVGAIEGIKKILTQKSSWSYNKTLCFVIEQIEVGVDARTPVASWIFNDIGKLECHNFKKGDIVEVLDLDRNEKLVHLGIVADDNYVVSDLGFCSGDSDKLIMKPRHKVPEDVREFLNYCLEHLGHKKESTKYKCDIFDDQTHNSVDYTLLCPYYDTRLGRYVLRLGWENYKEDHSDTVLPGNLSDEELNDLRSWLGEMKYGKTRLWYILREFHFYQDEENPPLPLDLTFDELVFGTKN